MQDLALVVRAFGGNADVALSYETYALAFTTQQHNWSGDQLAGDVNVDGIVNVEDLLQLVGAWRAYGGRSDRLRLPVLRAAPEDINLDGWIDSSDFALLVSQWQQRSPWHQAD